MAFSQFQMTFQTTDGFSQFQTTCQTTDGFSKLPGFAKSAEVRILQTPISLPLSILHLKLFNTLLVIKHYESVFRRKFAVLRKFSMCPKFQPIYLLFLLPLRAQMDFNETNL